VWLKRHRFNALAFSSGILATLSLAPLSWWPLAILSPALLFWSLIHCPRDESILTAWWGGFGVFISGVSWVYVSIHFHSDTPVIIAGLMTLLFCNFLALFFALLGWTFKKVRHTPYTPLTFAALWLLMDSIRGSILTGFPWLYLGHAFTDSPIAKLIAIIGVNGATFCAVLAGALLSQLFSLQKHGRQQHAYGIIALCASLSLLHLIPIDTSKLGDKPLSVGIAQGNIPQKDKWKPEKVRTTLSTYLSLTEPLWGKDIVVWPESAITIDYYLAQSFLSTLDDIANENHTSLITGIPYVSEDYRKIHNSITAVGLGDGLYHKQKLVPFGEYVPLQHVLRGALAFFDLPMSSFTKGPEVQSNLSIGKYKIAPYICYEIAYSEFVRDNLKNANAIVTISNDAWFGGSWAPWQHQQIAQARALETGRYILRATNDGISSVISPDGKLLNTSQQFVATQIDSEIWPISGKTPFLFTGNDPLLLLCALIVIFAAVNAVKIAKD
jgi:apolipoprotein N-acyltransferase